MGGGNLTSEQIFCDSPLKLMRAIVCNNVFNRGIFGARLLSSLYQQISTFSPKQPDESVLGCAGCRGART